MRKRPLHMLILFVIVGAIVSGTTWAENWPWWRGPGRQGISTERGLPVRWSLTENVAWKAPIPGVGHSSPIVWGDRVFVTTATDEGRSYRLVCLDRLSGRVLWDRQVLRQPAGHKQSNNSYATPTPATDGRAVYCLAADGTIAAVTLEGDVSWTYKDFEYFSEHGIAVSPVLYDGLVIVPFDWSSPGPDPKIGWQKAWNRSLVLALDTKTGHVRWRGQRGLSRLGHVTPQIARVDGVDQLISAAGDVVQGFDLRTGRRLWTIRGGGEGVVPSIVMGDGLVFATTGFGDSQVLAVRPGGSGDVTATNIAWTTVDDVPKIPSMLYVRPYLYVPTETGVLRCLEAATGKEVYRERLGGAFWASPVWAEGRLYLLSNRAQTLVIEDGPSFNRLATNDLDGAACLASMAISQGCLFIRTAEGLYCIGRP